MKEKIERYVIAIPILMFCELVFLTSALSVLFYYSGENFNRLNNEGVGNILNAVGIVAGFYVVYWYGLIRILTLGLTLSFTSRRRLWTACGSAIAFGGYSLLFMNPVAGPGGEIWLVWALTVLFNFALPFWLPDRVFS